MLRRALVFALFRMRLLSLLGFFYRGKGDEFRSVATVMVRGWRDRGRLGERVAAKCLIGLPHARRAVKEVDVLGRRAARLSRQAGRQACELMDADRGGQHWEVARTGVVGQSTVQKSSNHTVSFANSFIFQFLVHKNTGWHLVTIWSNKNFMITVYNAPHAPPPGVMIITLSPSPSFTLALPPNPTISSAFSSLS